MARGHVQRWDGQTGRILDAADGATVFFGDRALRGGLKPLEVRPGLEVEFDREASERGPRARNVRRAGAGPASPGTGETSPRPQATPKRPAASSIPEPPAEVPVPKALQDVLRSVPPTARHPGLQLDKYLLPCPQQEQQREALAEVAAIPGDANLLAELGDRRSAALAAIRATPWRGTTTTPLTLHLARASALENAGICLHPVYGFAYLPGTGLKGMARAYAETVWLPAQSDPKTAWGKIEAVFGWAPGSDIIGKDEHGRPQVKPWKPPGTKEHGKDEAGASGEVIFHDGWPVKWPRLTVDIVNNHHSQYYQKGEPPGDWEDPSMISFLAVEPGTTFEFALSLRRPEESQPVEGGFLDLACTWLAGALCHVGAGAKTAAGYGYFRPVDGPQPEALRHVWNGALSDGTRCAYELGVAVELVSPAFLGGADRHAASSLRLPSLKGLLRFWWRAWHGDLTLDELPKREAAVFGSTDQGCGLMVLPAPQQPALKILGRGTDMGGGGSPLGYLGYGPIAYDKSAKANLTQFDALAPDETLKFRLTHQRAQGLADGLKALWLLAALGGIGSRSRRGWGSLTLHTQSPLDGLPHLAACPDPSSYREALQRGMEALAPSAGRRTPEALPWTALSAQVRIVLSPTPFSSASHAHEDLGRRFIAFRARDRRGSPDAPPGPDYHDTKALLTNGQPPEHLPERTAFGMPYAQAYRSLEGRRATFTPVWRDDQGKREAGRRASPLFCKIVRLGNGTFLWQVAFLPARFLPDGAKVLAERTDVKPAQELPNSPYDPPGPFGVETDPDDPHDTLLNEFLDWLEGKAPQAKATSPTVAPPRPAPKPAAKPVNKGQTRSGLLRRKGSQWVAVFPGDDREAVVINSGKIPGDLPDECPAEFYIQEASKASGIRARFERRL